jgi:hypothetical protein
MALDLFQKFIGHRWQGMWLFLIIVLFKKESSKAVIRDEWD